MSFIKELILWVSIIFVVWFIFTGGGELILDYGKRGYNSAKMIILDIEHTDHSLDVSCSQLKNTLSYLNNFASMNYQEVVNFDCSNLCYKLDKKYYGSHCNNDQVMCRCI